MAVLLLFLIVALQLLIAVGTELKRSPNDTSAFVTVKDGQFQLNGSSYRFYGTNAYWAHMTTDEDMERTFHDIATAGLQVVRTWAFNDVSQKPASGTYFQILQDCKATINDGPDGLQRLDKVVATADKYGLKLLLTLTNNWGVDRPQPASSFRARQEDPSLLGNSSVPGNSSLPTNSSLPGNSSLPTNSSLPENSGLPRSYLSNDYGGMDIYNRAFDSNPWHDDFYTKPAIIDAFKNYISHVVPRYVNSSAILGWELANDPRCSSTLPGCSKCNTHTITKWVADISGHIKSLDSNHLITAGDGGFYCEGCPKIYATSSSNQTNSTGGPTLDGSFGVDTEDIISIPCIDFGSFQLFPDQLQYFPGGNADFAVNAISQGSKWVAMHSGTATTFQKPQALTAFGIVTKNNWPLFVPFNSSTRMPEGAPCGGVDDFQEDYSFVAWTGAGLGGNVGGALEYQWQQKGLEDVPHVSRKRQVMGNDSPQDGYAHSQDPYTMENIGQTVASRGL